MVDQLYVPTSAQSQDATATDGQIDPNEVLEEQAASVPKEVETAFVVWLDDDGTWVGASDLTLVKPRRPATLNDMFSGASTVADDVSTNKTAQHLMNMMNMQAQAMQKKMTEQQQASQLLQKIQQQGGFRRG